MIELYHNAASTCSQKVRLVLAEKGLDFVSHDVDLIGGGQHDPDYTRLNPNHVVPTIVHDGYVAIESTMINEYLDDAFPEPPMRPSDAAGRHAMRMWTHAIDALHPNAGVITFGIGARPMLVSRSPEEIEASIEQIPDPARRAIRRSVIEKGVEAPEMVGAVRAFIATLDRMETDLTSRPFLAGEAFSLADAAALPYVMRLDHLAMTPLVDACPRVSEWYARVRARASFDIAVSKLLPEPIVAMFHQNGEAVWGDLEKALDAA